MPKQFKELDLVWAKLHGYPWWPAYVRSVDNLGRYEVVFLSDFSLSYLPNTKLRVYNRVVEKREGSSKAMALSMQRANNVLKGKTTIIDMSFGQNSKCPQGENNKRVIKAKSAKEATSTASGRKDIQSSNNDTTSESVECSKVVGHEPKVTTSPVAGKTVFKKEISEKEQITLSVRLLEQRLESIIACLEIELEVEKSITELCDISSQAIETPAQHIYASKVMSLLSTGLETCKKQLKHGRVSYMEVLAVFRVLLDQTASYLTRHGFAVKLNSKAKKSALSNSNIANLKRVHLFGLRNNYISDMTLISDRPLKKLSNDDRDTNVSSEVGEIDPVLVRRVRIKLAKTIYLQSDRQSVQKREFKAFAQRIEEILQNCSGSEDDYKAKAVNLVRNLEKGKAKVRGDILKHLNDEEDHLLARKVNKLISN